MKPSPMTKRLAKQTEADLKKLALYVEKCAITIGGRFGDIDQGMVNQADELRRMVDDWIAQVREYSAEMVAEDVWNL